MTVTRINTDHLATEQFASTLPADDPAADGLAYSAELVDRVHREAEEAVRFPWWFWEVAIVAVVGAIAASAVWPMGVAP